MNGGRVLDAVVVGGGPAGSTVATLLRRAGADVALCDAARFPRHKICGEYVPPAALNTFAGLGVLAEVEALGPLRHVGMAVVSPDGTKVLGRYGGEARGLSVRRHDLDRVLLDGARRAGVAVFEEARVTGFARGSGGIFEVRVRSGGVLRARAVVGADGRNSLVARRLGLRRREPRHRKWAVMGHFRDVETEADHGEMIVTPYGYCGINPLPGGLANVCIVVDRATIRGPAAGGARLAGFFDRHLAAHPLTRRRMARAVLAEGLWAAGPMACRAADSVADGVLLVGDAAGFYDPFTGEGIGMALRGAEMAAEALAQALRRGEVTRRALQPYAAARRAAFHDRLRLDRLLQALLRRPRLADWAARRLSRDQGLADLLARVTGDTVAATEVLGPGFVARLLMA
jgi:geranylgeranyl reductase family protein